MSHIQKNSHFSVGSVPLICEMIYDAKMYQSDLLLLTSTGIVRLSKDTNYNVSGSIDNSFERHTTIYFIQDDVLVTLEKIYQQQKRYSFYSIKENKLIGSYVSKSDYIGDNLFLSESLSEEPVFYVLNNNVFQKICIKNNQVVWSVEISHSKVRDIFPISNHRFLFIHTVGTIEESNIVIDQKESAIIKKYPFSTLIKTNTGFFQSINDHELLLEDFQNNNTYNLYKITITEDSIIEAKLLFEMNASIALNQQNVRLIIDKQNENAIVVFFDALMDNSQKLDIQAINLKTGKIGSIRKKDQTALQDTMQINNSLLYRIFMNKKTLFILNQDSFVQDQGTGINSTLHSYLLNAITDFYDQAKSKIWSVSFNSPLQQQQQLKLSELNRFFFGEKYFCHLFEYGIELLDTQYGTIIKQERMRIDLKGGNYFCLYDDIQDLFIVITNNKLLLIN